MKYKQVNGDSSGVIERKLRQKHDYDLCNQLPVNWTIDTLMTERLWHMHHYKFRKILYFNEI